MQKMDEYDFRLYTLPHGTPEWSQIKENLQKLSALQEEDKLKVVLGTLKQVTKADQDPQQEAAFDASEKEPRILRCNNLLSAGREMEQFYPDFNIVDLMQNIAELALDIEELFENHTINGLQAGDNGTISLSRAQVRCLNAHGFLGSLRYSFWPRLDFRLTFTGIFQNEDSVSQARIQCMLCYFHETLHSDFAGDDIITYTRRRPETTPDWKNSEASFQEVQVFDNVLIEDQPASCQLDFANEALHIAQIIPSATQEEVVFSIRPECFPAMLFMDQMDDIDSIILGNVQRYCNYTGYLHTFKFSGPYTERTQENEVHVLAIDAVINCGLRQFEPEKMTRDLNKAYSGFSHSYPDDLISTGMWGCGIFNGDPTLKFIQQMMVAAVCSKKMFYSCYLNENLAQHLQELGDYMCENMTVKDAWKLIQNFDGRNSSFTDYVDSNLVSLGESSCTIS